jgi:hypothetical protein
VEQELKLPYDSLGSLTLSDGAPQLAALAMRYASPELVPAGSGGRSGLVSPLPGGGSSGGGGGGGGASDGGPEEELLASVLRQAGAPLGRSQRMVRPGWGSWARLGEGEWGRG